MFRDERMDSQTFYGLTFLVLFSLNAVMFMIMRRHYPVWLFIGTSGLYIMAMLAAFNFGP